MPINAGPEYFVAEKKYLEAKNKDEKIKALEEMIRTLPKHKGTEHLLAQLRKRLSNLKKENVGKVSKKSQQFSIRKEGAAQICLIGLTKSGKSTILKNLTNANPKIADYPFTTKEPVFGMMNYNDMQFQIVEIPSTFENKWINILHSCDLIIVLIDSSKNEESQRDELTKILQKNNLQNKKIIFVSNRINLEELKEKIWKELNLIKVYTKSPGKEKDLPALGMKSGSTIKDLTKEIHKEFLKNFKFARVFNNTKFSGQKAGLDYKLKDSDVIEIHTE